MGKRDDGLDRVRALNPVDESEVDGPDSPHAQELLADITSGPRRPSTRHAVVGRPMRAALTLGAVVLVTTAAAWVWTSVIDKPNAISCYQAADLDADIAAAPAANEATAEACATVWRDAVLENTEIVPIGSVPPLTACVAENGGLAVFPTDDTTVCDQLGLAYPDPTDQDQANSLRSVEEALISYFQSEACILMADAEAEVRRILDDAGLNDWTIQPQPENPDRPCSSHSFSPDSQTVHLIPIPRG